jgi:hypothetical protein
MFSVGGNADGTDLTETHGFFNCVVFNNCVENLRTTTDVWSLRGHFVFAAALSRLFPVFGNHRCLLE